MRRSGLVMGIIIPTKPCYADRKKARVQRSRSTSSSLFTFSFCAAEGKGGLQRGKREGAQDILDPSQLGVFLAYVGTPAATAIGFYSWKAKAENVVKIKQANPTATEGMPVDLNNIQP